ARAYAEAHVGPYQPVYESHEEGEWFLLQAFDDAQAGKWYVLLPDRRDLDARRLEHQGADFATEGAARHYAERQWEGWHSWRFRRPEAKLRRAPAPRRTKRRNA